jgi:NitT/TauT family transport system ATP-binding protein
MKRLEVEERSSQGPAAASGITVVAVTKMFKLPGRTITALEDVSFSVGTREFCAIIGPSGCGKSTLLRIISDVIRPEGGRVIVNGRSAGDARADREFGFVFQDPVLLPWRTALANVELPMEVAGIPRAERRRRAADLLSLVGLGSFTDAHPGNLSGGMARRVAIARALALRPGILLLDEPFQGLDEITRRRLNVELQRIWLETDTTAILVTHNIDEAVYLSDRVLVMGSDPGRIVADIQVNFPRPRGFDVLQDVAFFAYTRQLTQLLVVSDDDRALQT